MKPGKALPASEITVAAHHPKTTVVRSRQSMSLIAEAAEIRGLMSNPESGCVPTLTAREEAGRPFTTHCCSLSLKQQLPF